VKAEPDPEADPDTETEAEANAAPEANAESKPEFEPGNQNRDMCSKKKPSKNSKLGQSERGSPN
jgi:hypothetical protein